MTDEVSKSDWERQRGELGWPDPYSGELRGLELGGLFKDCCGTELASSDLIGPAELQTA